MFKKVLHIFAIVILLGSTAGVIIDKHFCCDRLVSITIGRSADCCKHPDCCRHEVKLIKVVDQFQQTQNKIGSAQGITPLIYIETNTVLLPQCEVRVQSNNANSPPPLYLHSLPYLQMFLI